MDLNEKLAQRRKEREQKYISEKIHDISNKKSGLPFSLNIILSVIGVLVYWYFYLLLVLILLKIKK